MIAVSRQSKVDLWAWARERCAAFKVIAPDFNAMGFEVEGALGAAVFYDNWRAKDCNISVLIDNPRVVTRATLRKAFQYPFADVPMPLHRMTAVVNSTNAASISMTERLGFKREGIRRQVYANGADEIIYGMLRSECPWITLRDKFEDPHTGGAF